MSLVMMRSTEGGVGGLGRVFTVTLWLSAKDRKPTRHLRALMGCKPNSAPSYKKVARRARYCGAPTCLRP